MSDAYSQAIEPIGSLDLRRRMAMSLLNKGIDASPVGHWTQALARVMAGGMGGMELGNISRTEREGAEGLNKFRAGLLSPGGGPAPQPAPAPMPPMGTPPPQENPQVPLGSSRPAPVRAEIDLPSAIAKIESGGRYDARGPLITSGAMQGQRAIGKYQIMESNVPVWTGEVLGQPMTPEQFAANPQAQDIVAKTKLGQLAQKYGPEGAARAWFAGEGGMNNLAARDQLGTTVGSYGQRVAQALGGQPQAQMASQPIPQQNDIASQISGALGSKNPIIAAGVAKMADHLISERLKKLAGPQYAEVRDPSGNVVAQRNTQTGKIEENPLAVAQTAYSKELAQTRAKAEGARASGESPAQKAVDQAFGKEYAEYVAGGGYADVQKQLGNLNSVIERLGDKTKPAVSGPVIGNVPDRLQAFNNPDAIATRERVEEVAQRNLRAVLGGQFAQKEGEALIKRAYNPLLPPAENAARVKALIASIDEAAKQKSRAADYFEKNGTLTGFKGNTPTLSSLSSDFESRIGGGERSTAKSPPPGVDPDAWAEAVKRGLVK